MRYILTAGHRIRLFLDSIRVLETLVRQLSMQRRGWIYGNSMLIHTYFGIRVSADGNAYSRMHCALFYSDPRGWSRDVAAVRETR